MEKESGWLSKRRKEDESGKQAETDLMEWEEHDLEFVMASMGLEAEDLCRMEEGVGDEEDWLDAWMRAMESEGCESMEVQDVEDEDAMEIANLEGQGMDMDFVEWLVVELKEMCISDEIIDNISECVRSAACPGGCLEKCGSSVQEEQTSAQIMEMKGYSVSTSTDIDECVRNMLCPGGCMGRCVMGGSNTMQTAQGSTEDIKWKVKSNLKTQEFGMPGGRSQLETRSGRVGGFVHTRNFALENNISGERRNNPVSVSLSGQTVHSDCTHVRPVYESKVALDWTGVGGVVHNDKGLFKNNIEESAWKPKYTPNWEKLPEWVHPNFKPDCSRRMSRKYIEDNRDIISSRYPGENIPIETGRTERGRGRRISGHVEKAVKRIEEREGGRKRGRETQKREEEEGERLECKPWEGGVPGGGGRSKKRGGRVSNTVKTLEEGAKQANKIFAYFSYFSNSSAKCKEGRENGHPLSLSLSGAEKLCGGVKRNMCEDNESENVGIVGSASKRARVTE
jgi:hypothetical protein